MAFISLDSPSCEVPCLILLLVVYRDVTRQAKGLYHLKNEVALKRGLAYLSRCNSGWFCHTDIIDISSREEPACQEDPTPEAPEDPLMMVDALVNLQDPILKTTENLAMPADTLVGLQDL
jgi:hypothetical protein